MQILTTPGWPNNYPNYKHCEWEIVSNTTSDEEIFLNFGDFEVEGGGCQYDYVQVTEDGNLRGKMCGTDGKGRSFRAKRRLKVVFHSDLSTTLKGFRAVFLIGKCVTVWLRYFQNKILKS